MQKFERNLAIKFSLQLGDFIYACAGIRQICDILQCQADLYIGVDLEGLYQKEIRDEQGNIKIEAVRRITFPRVFFDMVKPLISAQDWCNSIQEYIVGQPIDLDLDITMKPDVDVNMPYGHLPRWFFQVFPYLSCDLSNPWLHVDPIFMPDVDLYNTLLINRTARYRNEPISYSFLDQYKGMTLFIGLPDEHAKFQEETNLKIPRLDVTDFLQLARVIKSCKAFLGNQSMCFALAEAMKVPRILEICRNAPNVIPEGPGGYDFLYQHGLEHHVKTLMK